MASTLASWPWSRSSIDDLIAGLAEFLANRNAIDRNERLLAIVADDDPFAGGQAIGFDDDRRVVALGEIGRGLPRIAEDVVVGGRHVGVAEQILAEHLACFELGSGLRRAERPQPRLLEGIDQPGRERGLGPDDREIDLVLPRELEQALDVGRRDIDVLGVERGAGVAGGHEHTLGPAALAELPSQSVFAATISND